MEVEDELGPGLMENVAGNGGNNQSGRESAALPSGGVDLKLSLSAGAHQKRGLGESCAEAAPAPGVVKERDMKEKGLKRKKQRRPKPNKKLWLGRKVLDVAGGASPGAFVHTQPAPNNTTQFIMEDHTDLDLQSLDARLTAREAGLKSTRARDSSFSIDSDEEFSSSPEDEEYLSKEFSNTYEDVHVERLGTMSKLDLIQEYLQLEQRVDLLEKRLKTSQNTSSATTDSGGNGGTDSDSEIAEGEMPMEPAMAEKIRIFQEEIQKLVVENEQLVHENQRLQSSSSLNRPSSLSSSVDSESDSSTSSGSSSSSSSGQSRCSRLSKSSRSSGASERSGKSSAHVSFHSANERENSDVEMAVVAEEDKSTDLSSGQEMDSEISRNGQVAKDTPLSDNSVISSVAAH